MSTLVEASAATDAVCADCGHKLYFAEWGWVDEAGRPGCHYRSSAGHVPVSGYVTLAPSYPDSLSFLHG